jgi:hypothetical protein
MSGVKLLGCRRTVRAFTDKSVNKPRPAPERNPAIALAAFMARPLNAFIRFSFQRFVQKEAQHKPITPAPPGIAVLSPAEVMALAIAVSKAITAAIINRTY